MNLTHLKEVILSPSHLAMVLEFVTGGSVAEVRLCRGGGALPVCTCPSACLPAHPTWPRCWRMWQGGGRWQR